MLILPLLLTLTTTGIFVSAFADVPPAKQEKTVPEGFFYSFFRTNFLNLFQNGPKETKQTLRPHSQSKPSSHVPNPVLNNFEAHEPHLISPIFPVKPFMPPHELQYFNKPVVKEQRQPERTTFRPPKSTADQVTFKTIPEQDNEKERPAVSNNIEEGHGPQSFVDSKRVNAGLYPNIHKPVKAIPLDLWREDLRGVKVHKEKVRHHSHK